MNPFAKIAIIVAIIGGALFGAYSFGRSVAKTEGHLAISKLNKAIADADTAHALERAGFEASQRKAEQTKADEMAAVDQQHQKEIHEREIISNRTIADLRAGTIGLRDKFTSCQRRSATGAAGAVATSASSGDAAASIELQQQDIELVLRIGRDADEVADQLRACQAVVRADRADAKGASKP